MREAWTALALVTVVSGTHAAPSSDQRNQAGRRIYAAQCAACHGARGEGQPGWDSLNQAGERPAPPHDRTGHTWKHSDAMLYRIVAEGWRDPFNKTQRLTMPAFGQTLAPQGDHVSVRGAPRHVIGYLRDSLFDPATVHNKVSTLSGGQKNRLLLAKILADPQPLLILDEPTNDLDMETLDMLEQILSEYTGTLIVVSHDRDFLDQTVTKILAFEGDAKVDGYIGGYSDYLEARRKKQQPAEPQKETKKKQAPPPAPAAPQPKKLSFKLQYELDNLPKNIEKLENEIAALLEILGAPDAFTKDRAAFENNSRRLAHAREELEAAETRWLELSELQQSVAT